MYVVIDSSGQSETVTHHSSPCSLLSKLGVPIRDDRQSLVLQWTVLNVAVN